MNTVIEVAVKKSFIELKGQFNKKGKPIKVPIFHRSMSIVGNFFGNVKKYQATLVKRSHNEFEEGPVGVNQFGEAQHKGSPERVQDTYVSVKKLVPAPVPFFKSDLIDNPLPDKWSKDANYSIDAFSQWLSKNGWNGPALVDELLTKMPEPTE